MNQSAFELGEQINNRKIEYKLHEVLWGKYDLSQVNLDFDQWTTIKYLNDDGTDFSDEIGIIPNDKGGLYMFSIECKVINQLTLYPVYIGRAQISDNQNLRKRCREYYTKFCREDERPRITKMINYWGKNLKLSFLVLEENDQTIDYEKKLINSLLLPFNTEIPETEIKQAVAAF